MLFIHFSRDWFYLLLNSEVHAAAGTGATPISLTAKQLAEVTSAAAATASASLSGEYASGGTSKSVPKKKLSKPNPADYCSAVELPLHIKNSVPANLWNIVDILGITEHLIFVPLSPSIPLPTLLNRTFSIPCSCICVFNFDIDVWSLCTPISCVGSCHARRRDCVNDRSDYRGI